MSGSSSKAHRSDAAGLRPGGGGASKIVLALLLTASCSITVEAQKAQPTTQAAQKWIRGLDARKEKFERLISKLKKGAEGPGANVPGAVPRALACPSALEMALVSALTDAHFANGTKEDFHLIFNAPGKNAPGKEQYLDVSYTYNQRGALLLTGIHKLPDGWRVAIQPGEINAGKFIVLTDDATGCIFEFDSADPFASRATPAERE